MSLKNFARERFLRILIGILPLLLDKLTPSIRIAVHEFVRQLGESARETTNPYDDYAVDILKEILGIDE